MHGCVTDDLSSQFNLPGAAIALALGLLIGVQRGWAQRADIPGSRFAGIRTFGLLGLTGGIAGSIHASAPSVALIVLGTTAMLILASYYRDSRQRDRASGTGSIVGLLTMTCGFLAATGNVLAASVTTGSMILLLSLRARLHGWVGRMSEADVRAIASLALISLVVLPLLPDRPYGPFDAWNPRQLWLVVVLVYGLTLAGYVAAKLLGPTRGILATAAAGAVVSSTAVTASLAHRLERERGRDMIYHAGISAASAVMFLRVMVLVAVLAPFALGPFSRIAVPAMLVSLAGTVIQLRLARHEAPLETPDMAVKNPAAAGPALLLVAMVMAMTLAARWVLSRHGDQGLAVVLAISGTVDVDSAVITMGSLPAGVLAPRTAALVLLAPVVLNSLFKAFLAGSIAGWRHALPGIMTMVLSALVAIGAALVLL
jgi:uncharacterized membrane protein (DUF4010 family)